jgi:hypothetical protein
LTVSEMIARAWRGIVDAGFDPAQSGIRGVAAVGGRLFVGDADSLSQPELTRVGATQRFAAPVTSGKTVPDKRAGDAFE